VRTDAAIDERESAGRALGFLRSRAVAASFK
jgi:hypothetical protein